MPYIDVISGILKEVKVWLYSLIGVVTIVVIIIQAFKYQTGEAVEKQEALKNIRRTIIMSGGVFLLAWLADYVIGKMASV
jgi:hypothetical protein